MESLQIRTGQISLMILDDAGDERGVFKFNPEDIELAKKVMNIQAELNVKTAEYEERSKFCETTESKVELLSEAVNYFKELVDTCFGEGTSALVFGDANTLSMFEDFFNGITPYFEKASKKRMEKYRKKGK